MRRWCREHGLQCSQSRFTAGSLGRGKRPTYAEIKAKAHNCRVMLGWLSDLCFACRQQYGEHGWLVSVKTWSIAKFCQALDSHRHWKLPEHVASELYELGHAFLKVSDQ